MSTQKKYVDPDGDSAHWESAREKEKAMEAPRKSGIYVQQEKASKKRITPSDSNSSVKYTGKSVSKKSAKKVITKR